MHATKINFKLFKEAYLTKSDTTRNSKSAGRKNKI